MLNNYYISCMVRAEVLNFSYRLEMETCLGLEGQKGYAMMTAGFHDSFTFLIWILFYQGMLPIAYSCLALSEPLLIFVF